MRISRRQVRKAVAKGATMNGGKSMRLRSPFDTLAVRDGAFHLTSSANPGQVLMVPADAKAYLTGLIADALPDGKDLTNG